jgi:hypothetical protein
MWWSNLYFAQPPKPRKKAERVSSDPMATAPKRSMCSDLLSGHKEQAPHGLGILEDSFMNASTDHQLDETLFRLRKLSQSFRADYMGTFQKPHEMEHLNDLIFNHNNIARKKAPIRSESTPTFVAVMEKDKEFSDNVKKLKKDFFKQQKDNEKVHRGKRHLQELLMAEPSAPVVGAKHSEPKKKEGPPREKAQRKVITKQLAENLLTDYYSMYQYFAHDHEPPTAHQTVADLFYDFLDFVMTLYGVDSNEDRNSNAFEEIFDAVSFIGGDTLSTNEWLTNVAFLQQKARKENKDPPPFAKRHQGDLLDLFRLLMEQSGDNRGCITRERFIQLQSIGDFMYDAVEQSKILGSNAKGIEKARSMQTIRKSGYIPEKPASTANKLKDLGENFKAGRLNTVSGHFSAKEKWISDVSRHTQEMHEAQRKKLLETAAEGGHQEVQEVRQVRREKTFIHKADGSVEVQHK